MDFDVNLGFEPCQKSYQKSMDFELKNRENCEKNYSPNDVIFDCIFPLILGGFGKDFGWVLGRVWRILAPLGPLFGVIFPGLYSELSPKWLLEASGFHFGSIFKGSGEISGGFGEGWGEFAWPKFVFLLHHVF